MNILYELARNLGISGLGVALLLASADPGLPPPEPLTEVAAPEPEPVSPPPLLAPQESPESPPTAADLAALMVQRGQPVLDLERDARACPGPSPSRVETTARIQAAIDAFALPGLPDGQKTLTIRGTYYTDYPLFIDQSHLRLVGDGQSTISAFNGSTVFYVGVPRTPLGKALSDDHAYDLFGVLDAQAASGPGQRWGLRFHGDSHAAFAASGLALDAGEASAITIDYGLDTRETGNRIGPIVGVESYGRPAPWQICRMDDYRGGTRTAILFRTSDGRDHIAYVADPEPGVHRVSIQIDTETATLRAWIDGQAAAVDGGGLKDWKAGVPLARNEDVLPLKINSCGPRANWFGSDWWSYDHPAVGGLDFGLIGLQVSTALRYQDRDDQARIDGQAINDRTRFFAKDEHTAGLLTLDQPPSELGSSRLIRSLDSSYFGTSHGLFLSDTHDSVWTAVVDTEFEGLRINNYGGHANQAGEAITLGFALYTRIERCELEGGQHGLGTWHWGSNYVTRCYETSFTGADAGVSGYNGMFVLRDCSSPSTGRHMMRFNMCSATIDWFWSSDGGASRADSYIRAHESVVNARDFHADNESANGPRVAVFHATTGARGGTPNGGFLQLHNLDLAAPRADVPVVLLGGEPSDPRGILDLSGRLVIYGDRTAPLVSVQDQDHWSVNVTLDPAITIRGLGQEIQVQK